MHMGIRIGMHVGHARRHAPWPSTFQNSRHSPSSPPRKASSSGVSKAELVHPNRHARTDPHTGTSAPAEIKLGRRCQTNVQTTRGTKVFAGNERGRADGGWDASGATEPPSYLFWGMGRPTRCQFPVQKEKLRHWPSRWRLEKPLRETEQNEWDMSEVGVFLDTRPPQGLWGAGTRQAGAPEQSRMDMYRDACAYRHECMFISVQMCIGRVYGRG